MHHLWLVPAVPLALFGLGLGLMLCDIKPGLVLMAAAWLLCVPAALYGSVRLAMTRHRAVQVCRTRRSARQPVWSSWIWCCVDRSSIS